MIFSLYIRAGQNRVGGCKSILFALLAIPLAACETGTIGSGGSLSWTAPSMREDGSGLSLADIAGYRIYYSETKGDYSVSNSVFINGSSTTQASLPAGVAVLTRYYVVMTTVDVDGRESRFSEPALEFGGSQ